MESRVWELRRNFPSFPPGTKLHDVRAVATPRRSMRDDDDDRCSPRRCFLACLGCGCFCLALPTVAGLFSGGTSVGAAEHLQEVRSIVLSGYAPALISGYLQKRRTRITRMRTTRTTTRRAAPSLRRSIFC